MTVQDEIAACIASQPPAKRADIQTLHNLFLGLMPGCRLWFLDGRNAEGKVVSNPNIGYGQRTMAYADGTSREFYRIGMSGNTSGISVYIMGIEDKTYLSRTYGARLGKASVTGYCIRFKALKDIDRAVLEEAVREAAGRV